MSLGQSESKSARKERINHHNTDPKSQILESALSSTRGSGLGDPFQLPERRLSSIPERRPYSLITGVSPRGGDRTLIPKL